MASDAVVFVFVGVIMTDIINRTAERAQKGKEVHSTMTDDTCPDIVVEFQNFATKAMKDNMEQFESFFNNLKQSSTETLKQKRKEAKECADAQIAAQAEKFRQRMNEFSSQQTMKQKLAAEAALRSNEEMKKSFQSQIERLTEEKAEDLKTKMEEKRKCCEKKRMEKLEERKNEYQKQFLDALKNVDIRRRSMAEIGLSTVVLEAEEEIRNNEKMRVVSALMMQHELDALETSKALAREVHACEIAEDVAKNLQSAEKELAELTTTKDRLLLEIQMLQSEEDLALHEVENSERQKTNQQLETLRKEHEQSIVSLIEEEERMEKVLTAVNDFGSHDDDMKAQRMEMSADLEEKHKEMLNKSLDYAWGNVGETLANVEEKRAEAQEQVAKLEIVCVSLCTKLSPLGFTFRLSPKCQMNA